MPHAHIVLKLSDVPVLRDNKDATINWVDEYITARMPSPLNGNSTDDDRKYRFLVESHMIHECNWTNVNGCKKSATCKCKRGFDDTEILEHTEFDEKGFPNYRRDFECDLRVVSHNKRLLCDWEGHANVEYAGGSRCVLYLYKYLYKGAKKVKVNVTSVNDDDVRDEISLYLRGRFLCAMDAMWCVLGYQTYPAPYPPVHPIKTKMPSVVRELLLENKSCDMLVYFNRPEILRDLKYIDVFKNYVAKNTLPARFRNRPELQDDINGFFVIAVQGLRQPLYLYQRTDTDVVIRLDMLYITSGIFIDTYF